jgi:WD40 repeat protein
MEREKEVTGSGVDKVAAISTRQNVNVFLCHNSIDKPAVKQIADAIELDFGIPHFLDAYAIPVGEQFIPWIERALAESSGCAIFLGANGWGPTHLWEAELALARARKDQEFRLVPVALPGMDQSETLKLGSGTVFRDMNWANFGKGLDDPEAIEKFRSTLTGEKVEQGRGPARLTPYQIRRDAARWVKSAGDDRSVLYRGKQLNDADKLARENADILAVGDVVAFLQESRRRQSRARSLMMLSGTAAMVIIAVSIAIGVAQYLIADQRRMESESRRLALLARDADGADGQILFSIQAYRQSQTVEASRTLREQLSKWKYLDKLIGAGQAVEALAVLGTSIFIGLEDGTLLKLKIATGETEARLIDPDHHGRVTALLAVEETGELWIGREDGTLDILRRANSPALQKVTRMREPPAVRVGRNASILCLSTSLSRGLIVVGTGSGEVFAVDSGSGQVRWRIYEGEMTQITALATDTAGARTFYGSQHGVMKVVETTNGRPIESIPGFQGGVMLIAPQVDSDAISVLSSFGQLKRLVPSLEGYQFRETVQMPSMLTAAVAIPAKGLLALGDGNGNLFLRENFGGAAGLESIMPHRSVVRAIAKAGSERLVSASDDGTIAVWSLSKSAENAELPTPPIDPSILRIDKMGRLLASGTKTGQAGVWVLEAGAWRLLADFIAESVSAAGEAIIKAPPDLSPDDGFIPKGDDEIFAIAMNPSATAVAWITRADGIFWRGFGHAETGAQLLGQLPEESMNIALNVAGTEVAVALKDIVYLYHAGGGSQGATRKYVAPGAIRSVAYHPDGLKLALGLEDGRIALMRSADGIVTIVGGPVTRGPAGGIGYDSTGERIIVNGVTAADRRIIVVDASNLERAVTLQVRQAGGSISAQAISAYSNRLVTGDRDGRLILWDLKNQSYVESIDFGGSAISAATFDEANHRLITASSTSGLIMVSLEPEELVSQLCAKIGPGIEAGFDFRDTLIGALSGCL